MGAGLNLPVLRLPPVATPMVPPRFVVARAVPWKEWEEAIDVAASGAELLADDELALRPLADHGAIAMLVWAKGAPVDSPSAFIASAVASAPHLVSALRAARDLLTGTERAVRVPYGADHVVTVLVPCREDG